MRRSILLLCALLGGCATPTLSPSQFAIVETHYGLYSRMGQTNEMVHARETMKLPCAADALFGVDLEFQYSIDRRMKLPVVAEWRQPPVPGVRPAVVRFLPDPYYVVPGKFVPKLQAVVGFDSEKDLVDGDYEIRLFNPADNHLYYSRTFVLEDCR